MELFRDASQSNPLLTFILGRGAVVDHVDFASWCEIRIRFYLGRELMKSALAILGGVIVISSMMLYELSVLFPGIFWFLAGSTFLGGGAIIRLSAEEFVFRVSRTGEMALIVGSSERLTSYSQPSILKLLRRSMGLSHPEIMLVID